MISNIFESFLITSIRISILIRNSFHLTNFSLLKPHRASHELFSPLSYLSNFQLRSRLFPISMQMVVDGKLSPPTTDLINSRPSCFDASSLGLCTLKHFKTTSLELVGDQFSHIFKDLPSKRRNIKPCTRYTELKFCFR